MLECRGCARPLVVEASVTLNYTTVLNIGFLILAGALRWRFFRTGGLGMLRMMSEPQPDTAADHHGDHNH